jgi:hypothetical protein
VTDPTPGPGDQLPGESDRAFQAFRIYLEQGPRRSTAVVGEELGHRSSKQCEKWSAKWSWVDRVRRYEARAIETRDDAHMDAIAQRSRRQADLAQLHGEATRLVAVELLDRLTASDPATQESARQELRRLPLKDLLGLEATLARAHHRTVITERLALGITTEQPGEPVPRSQAEAAAAQLSDDELDDRLAPIDELAPRRDAKRKARTG